MNRREFMFSSSTCAILLTHPTFAYTETDNILTRPILSSDEHIPCIGMGTWMTFDVGSNQQLIDDRTDVLRQFFKHQGGMIDSSPMYGSAQAVLGKCFKQLQPPSTLFTATKVWTNGEKEGTNQIRTAEKLWGSNRFDLMQIHNLVGWKTHIKTLRDMKESGRIRYIGVTTSHGRRHDELMKIMLTEPLDFVQLTYNLIDTQAENRLLPLAASKGISVIINRPFQRGKLFDKVKNKTMPEWAKELDCDNWAQYFLKFIISHPAVTVTIPATSRIDHMNENMGALKGKLPNKLMRVKMQEYYRNI